MNTPANMNAPVYIITGFLGSGKTKFITEMLEDEGFTDGERTLLLCCEEGENEYDPALLRRCNTMLVSLEEMDELDGNRLNELDRQTRPERVIIEYNSMWMLEKLYSAKKPQNWDLAQIICLVDAQSFELYLKNMRNIMADGLKEADLIIFNRCTPETSKSPWRRAVLAMNNTARIFFENTDGTTEDGVSDEDLPFDVKAPIIEIADDQFGIFYLDAMDHADRYDGKTIYVKGRAFRMPGLPKQCFVFGRHAMTCCANDIGAIGYLCQMKGTLPKENSWIMLTAKVEAGFSAIHDREALTLIAQNVQPARPPKDELVYFNP